MSRRKQPKSLSRKTLRNVGGLNQPRYGPLWMSPAPVRPNEPIARAAPRATFGTRGPLRRGERSMRQQPPYTILAGVSREHSVGGGLPRFERIDAVPLRNTRGMGHEAGKAACAEPLHPRYRLNPRGSGISMIRQHGAAQPQNRGTIGEGRDSLKPRGAARIRTGDKGFAVLCLTTWPRRLSSDFEITKRSVSRSQVTILNCITRLFGVT